MSASLVQFGRWARRNLFAKPFDAALTLVVIPLLAWLVWSFLDWAFNVARWDVVSDSLKVMLVGVYPPDQLWRTWAAAVILAGLFGATAGTAFRLSAHATALLVFILGLALLALAYRSPVSAAWFGTGVVVAGAGWVASMRFARFRDALPLIWLAGLVALFAVLVPPGVRTWGGLLLSILVTVVAGTLTLPIGILLAFGRRSHIPSLRLICTAYIELMRSVPVILIVYWVWISLPLLAREFSVADVARGMIGFTLFYSAYVAEFVRSGLQSVPKGQVEAAQTLGMSRFDINTSIVLPQALRVVLPSLVGNFLDIFNNTPLLFIIGLAEFLRSGQMVLANPEYGDRVYEIYVFLFITYFAIGCLITFAARRIEAHLAKGAR